MFSLEEIKTAHSKVKSGADFPQFAKTLLSIGVKYYINYVIDGHTEYHGQDDYCVYSDAKYPALEIQQLSDPNTFRNELLAHQQGKSSYLEFCKQAADSGVYHWRVDLQKMTCSYYDVSDRLIYHENFAGA